MDRMEPSEHAAEGDALASGMLPSPLRRRAATAVRLGFPIVILALLWTLVDGQEVLRILRRADWEWLFAAFVAANLQIIFSAIRWRITARALDHDIAPGRAIWEYYLSQLLNLTLPSGILGDAGRAVRMRHQAGLVRSSQAVLIERMAGQIALFVVLFGGFFLIPWLPGSLVFPVWVRQFMLGIGLVLIGLVVVFALANGIPGPWRRAAEGFRVATVRALCAPGVWPWQVLLSALTVICNIAAVTFAARATGTHLTLDAMVTVVPLMLTAMLIPVSAGGWGLREGAAAALWPLMGLPAAWGVAASIAFGLVIMAASLPGLLMVVAPDRMTRSTAPGRAP
jgi:glycosyltransferase 2 family protein